MKSVLFQLRSLFAIIFILAIASACAQANGSPVAPPETAVAEPGEPATPSIVHEMPSATGESAEPTQQQATSVDGASSDDVKDRHFACATQADVNATIAVTTDTSIDGNLVLEPGDELAIFMPNGDICAGTAVWAGQNIAITAWGDDPQTEEMDGLIKGDPLHFRIWDASEQVEYQVADVDYQEGDGIFVEDGIYIVAALTIEEQ